MPLFGGRGHGERESERGESESGAHKSRLQRQLCLGREDPAPRYVLSACGLRELPQGLFSLCRVFRKEELHLQDNRLRDLRKGGDIRELALLQALYLTGNMLSKLTEDIGHLTSLVDLKLDDNKLVELPVSIGNLANLKTLDVARNRLKSLPVSLGKLKKLRRLNVKSNPDLRRLPKELSSAVNVKELELDAENFVYPPREVALRGTDAVMRFLCGESGRDYAPPEGDSDSSPEKISNDPKEDKIGDVETWEERNRELKRLEEELHEASKRQREKFLKNCIEEQVKLDSELNKIQSEKDNERSKLIRQIMEDEITASKLFSRLMELNTSSPERMRQFLEHDQRERDRLLDICRSSYNDLKTADTLRAMRTMMEEEYQNEAMLKEYGNTQSEVQRSFLMKELSSNRDLDDLLRVKNHQRAILIEKMLMDEEVQKAAVGSLLEKCDARAWSLVQEISLVESHLAKLSAIELDRKKLQIDSDLNDMADQRVKLSMLLVDLLDQQEERRNQLLETLKVMEDEKDSSNFWLIRYQQLLENVPEVVVSSQRRLDPILANYLLQEGVIHCLPFIVNDIDSIPNLNRLTDEDLKKRGVSLSSDRTGILKAVRLFIEELTAARSKLSYLPSAPSCSECDAPELTVPGPAAPEGEDISSKTIHDETECVVCMEECCSVVFVPCGHLCCCIVCSDSVGELCPMCRGSIDRKIRVIRP